MPGTWNEATELRMLLIMIHLTAAPKPKWDEVALLMGEGYTAAAVRQHFDKLRKDSIAKFGPPGTTPTGTPSKGVPRQKANSETPSKSTGKRKAAAQLDDELMESPIKKQFVKAELKDESESS